MKNNDGLTKLTVKVDVTTYDGALKERLRQLENERNECMSENARRFSKWKIDMTKWLAVEASGFIQALDEQAFEALQAWQHFAAKNRAGAQIDGDKLLASAPRLVQKPNDAACLIRRIEALRAQLGMTSQKTVTVSTEAIEGLGLSINQLVER